LTRLLKKWPQAIDECLTASNRLAGGRLCTRYKGIAYNQILPFNFRGSLVSMVLNFSANDRADQSSVPAVRHVAGYSANSHSLENAVPPDRRRWLPLNCLLLGLQRV
jgi:hypothetical protein